VRVLGGLHEVFVRVSAAAVLSVLVRRGVLVLLFRRRGLFPLLLLLLSLLGKHGLWLSAVGVAVGADLGEGGRLLLGDLPVLLAYGRLFALLVVARPALSPPPRRTAPCCCRWSGRRVPRATHARATAPGGASRPRDCILWGKPPDRGDTTPRHEPGTGREQSRNTPLGG